MYTALGYEEKLTPRHYRERYDRGDIAACIVEAFAKGTWRGVGEVFDEDRTRKSTQFEKDCVALIKRLRLWTRFYQADVLARLGNYSVLLIGAPGLYDTELKRLRLEDLYFVQPYSQENAKVESYVEDTRSPRFAQPEYYTLSLKPATYASSVVDQTPTAGVSTSANARTTRVHWTRVIHIAEGLLEDNVMGQSALARVWNRLDDLDKIVGGGAEAAWMRAHPGFQFNLPENFQFKDDNEKKKFQEEVDEFVNGMRRTVRTKGVEMNVLDAEVANFDPNAKAVLSIISGASRIPMRMLLGSEQGELASTQDRTNWTERVQDRRAEFAEPVVVRQFFDRLISLQALAPKNNEYQVWWPEPLDFPLTERVAVATKQSETNQRQGEIVITTDEIREQTLGLKPLKEVDPEAADFNTKKRERALAPPTPPGQSGNPNLDDENEIGNPDIGRGNRDRQQRPPKAAMGLVR